MARIVKHYATYRNKNTKYVWKKSRTYDTIAELLDAMKEYMAKNDTSEINLCLDISYKEDKPAF